MKIVHTDSAGRRLIRCECGIEFVVWANRFRATCPCGKSEKAAELEPKENSNDIDCK